MADQAPYALWVDGETSILSLPTDDFVTITGARAATSYGEHVSSMLASDLAEHGRVVVAGAAYGIDGTAHRAALASDGATVAVLASGVDRPYPSGHRDLIEQIAQRGACCGVLHFREVVAIERVEVCLSEEKHLVANVVGG